MAALVLLNGPPASGKSTIAQRFIDARPLSLNLDIDVDVDVVRGMLGGWLVDPSTAGLTARSLALAMAEAYSRWSHSRVDTSLSTSNGIRLLVAT